MKKILLVMLSVMLAFSFSACGRGRGSDSGDVGKDVYVSIVDAGLGREWMDKITDAYYEETGITVKVNADPDLVSSVETKINSSNSSLDDLYFVAQAGNSWISYASTNKMLPLNDVLNSDKYGTPAIERTRDNTAVKMGQYLSDDVLTIPYVYTCWGFVYNGGLLNSIESNGEYVKGVFPTTMQGLLDLCKAVKSAKLVNPRTNRTIAPFSAGLNVGYMNYLFFSLWHQLDPVGFQAYYDQNDRSGFNGNLLKSESAIKASEMVYDLIGATSSSDSNMVSNSQNHLESQTSFVNGDCVFTFSGSWFETEMRNIMSEVGLTDIHFAPYPVIGDNEKSSLLINYPGENFFIPAKAENAEGAKDFLDFCLSEKAVAIMEKSLNQLSLFTTSENVELIPFGKDISSAIKNSNTIYTWSENMVYRSGALSLFKMSTNPFSLMAKYSITDKKEIPVEMFEVEISKHIETWDTYMVLISDRNS